MSDLTKILADNQKEKLKLIAPSVKKPFELQNLGDSVAEAENVPVLPTSTPIKSKTIVSNNTPLVIRNIMT